MKILYTFRSNGSAMTIPSIHIIPHTILYDISDVVLSITQLKLIKMRRLLLHRPLLFTLKVKDKKRNVIIK